MATDISFIIQAIDKFSAVAKRIKVSMDAMNKSALKSNASFKKMSNSMKTAAQSASINSASIGKVTAATAAAAAATKAATVATVQVTTATRKTTVATRNVATSVRKYTAFARLNSTALARVAATTATTAAAAKKATVATIKLATSMRKAAASMRKAAVSSVTLSRSMNKVSRSMRDAGRAVTLRLTAPIALLGIGALVASAKIETMQISFDSLTGSTEKAKQVVKSLTDFAAKTPFQLEGIGKAATQLLAAGVTTGELNDRLKLLGDIASVTKTPLTDMSAIFAKIKNKGKAMTEELLQLSERGIPVIDRLAKRLNLTKDQIFKLAEKGKIKFDLITSVMRNMTKKGGIAFNAMEKQSQSLAGVFSTLKDNVFLASAVFGDSIVKTTDLKNKMKGLTATIQKMAEGFKKLSPRTKSMILLALGLTAVLGPLAIAVGLLSLALTPAAVTFLVFAAGIAAAGLAIAILGDVFIETFNAGLKFFQLFGLFKEIKQVETLTSRFGKLIGLAAKPARIPFFEKLEKEREIKRAEVAKKFAAQALGTPIQTIKERLASVTPGEIAKTKLALRAALDKTNFVGPTAPTASIPTAAPSPTQTTASQQGKSPESSAIVDVNFNNLPQGTQVNTQSKNMPNFNVGQNTI